MKCIKRTIACICIILCGAIILTSCTTPGKKLSNHIEGTWTAEINIAPLLYRELASEFGLDLGDTIDLTDDMEVDVDKILGGQELYVKTYLTFYEDGTADFSFDVDDMADAAGDFIEPFTSGIIGFDTSTLIDLLIEYVKADLDADEFDSASFTYEVDDKAREVILTDEDGESGSLSWDGKNKLELLDEEVLGQTLVFER